MKYVKENARMLALADFDGWSESQIKEHLVKNYEATQDEVDRFNILVAYECEYAYEGSSSFLLEDKATGDLFEVHASHCSCYGYEGQFEPESTTVEYLLSKFSGFYNNEDEAKKWVTENIRLTS